MITLFEAECRTPNEVERLAKATDDRVYVPITVVRALAKRLCELQDELESKEESPDAQ